MKAAIHNPYLDTLGGGERYTSSFAEALLDNGYDVDIEWHDNSIISKIYNRFNINLNKARVVQDINRGDGYDLVFWVSDGSIPMLKSRKNILHFQVPFKNVNGTNLMNKMKFWRINKVLCNSEFTKNFIDREYGIESDVLYPPVDTEFFKPKKKKDNILFVGRFSNLKQAKGQGVLINAFKQMVDSGLENWNLILAGGVEVGSDGYLIDIKKLATGYPIEFIESPNAIQLKRLYSEAKVYWSASGFGIDEVESPERVEHFGMGVVEAMSSKSAPLIFAAGGHKEIITDGEDGFLWKTEDELIDKTTKLIGNRTNLKNISDKSYVSAQKFSLSRFKEAVKHFV